MNRINGRIGLRFNIDYSHLERDAKHSSNVLKSVGDTVVSEGERIDAVFRKMATAGLGLFGITKLSSELKSLIGNIIKVRSEFQNTESTFKVFLGSAEKASKLMKDIQAYAFNNVFEFQDLTNQARQLLAYGHAAEDVIGIIDRLSNIASGANQPLEKLVELYNKAKSQGKLLTQDIYQWQRAGVPVIQQLAKEFGKTETEMWKMVTTGTVGFKEITGVVEQLTSEGGKFAGIMEEKMKNLSDSYGLLLDTITNKMNEFGEKHQETFRSGILLANDMVENYETLGKALMGLIATYGAYRVAVALCIQVERGWTVAQLAHYKALLLVEKGYKLLQATMLTNPYVALATVVVGLVATLWTLADTTDAQTSAQERLNEVLDQAKRNKDDLVSSSKSYINKIKDETQTINEQVAAYRELIRLFPEIKDMSFEKVKNTSNKELDTLLNRITTDRELQERPKKLEELKQIYSDLYKYKDTRTNAFYKVVEMGGVSKWGSYEQARAFIKDYISHIREQMAADEEAARHAQRMAQYEGLTVDEKNAKINESIAKLQEQKAEYESVIKSNKSYAEALGTPFARLNPVLAGILDKLKEINGEIQELTGELEDESTVKNKAYWQKQKKEALAVLEDMEDPKSEEAKKYRDIVNQAERELKKWDFSEKTASKYKAAQDKLKEQITSGELAVTQSRIAAMKDGLKKELAQRQFNFDQTIAKIEKDEKELKKAREEAGQKELTKEEQEGFNIRRANAYIQLQNETEEVNTKYKEEMSEMYRNIGDIFLSEEERKQAGIKKTYDEYRKWAKKALDGKDITETEYKDIIVRIKEAEDEHKLYDNLQEFRTYEQKRADIVKEYQEKIDLLRDKKHNGKYEENIKEARKQMNAAVAELDATMQQTSGLWAQLFDNFSLYTNKELQKIIDNAREVIAYVNSTSIDNIQANFGLTSEQLINIKNNSKELEAIYDALREKTEELNKRNPFAAIIRSNDEIKKTTEEIKKAEEQLKNIRKSGNAKAIKDAEDYLELLNRQKRLLKGELREAVRAAISYLMDLGDAMQRIGQAAGNAGLESFGKALSDLSGIAEQFASGDIIGGAISAVTTGLTAIFSSRSKYKAALKQMNNDLEAFAHSYKLILSDMRLQAVDLSNVFGDDMFAKAIVSLKEMKSMYDEYMAAINKKSKNDAVTALESIKIVTRHKTLFRSEKSKTLKELYPELFDDESGFNVDAARALLETNNQLNDAAKKQIQDVIDLYDQWQEAEDSFKDYLSSTFGDIGDSLGDSIIKAFEDGTDAMENWAESFNSVLKNLAKQLMQNLFFQKYFDQLQTDLSGIYENYGDDADQTGQKVTELLSNFFNNMSSTVSDAEEWYKNFAEQAANYGFDLSGDSSATATAKGFQAMSQDVGEQLNGQMNLVVHFTNLMHEDTADIRERTGEIHQYTSNIRDNMATLVSNSNAILNHVAAIHDNTNCLENIENHLYGIGNTVDKMDLHGVHMR